MAEPTVPQPPSTADAAAQGITREQAESYGLMMEHARPLLQDYFAHSERVNEQQRVAAQPVQFIVGAVVAAVAIGAVLAIARGDGQLGRDLLIPLLSFAGGLGVTRMVTTTTK